MDRSEPSSFNARGIAAGVLCVTLLTGCQPRVAPCGPGTGPDPAPTPMDAALGPTDAAMSPRDAAMSPRDAAGSPPDLARRSCIETLAGTTYLRVGVPWGNGRDVKPPATWPGPRVLDVYPTQVRFVGDCMDGSFAGPVALDSGGRFQVDGSVFISRGPGGGLDMGGGTRIATYSGEVRGDVLTLRIKFYDGTPDHQVALYCDDPIRMPMFC